MEEIIAFIKEKKREYKHGSDAYNVLRGLEITLPARFESDEDKVLKFIKESRTRTQSLIDYVRKRRDCIAVVASKEAMDECGLEPVDAEIFILQVLEDYFKKP